MALTQVAGGMLAGSITSSQISSVAGSTITGSQSIPKSTLPTGSVLQVVSATYSTTVTIASTSFVDTGLSCSITPTSSSSKILVLTSQPGLCVIGSNASRSNYIQLLRSSTAIFNWNWETNGAVGANGFRVDPYLANISYLDSPATTSSVTYKTQARGDSTADSLQTRWQWNGSISAMTLLEIAA